MSDWQRKKRDRRRAPRTIVNLSIPGDPSPHGSELAIPCTYTDVPADHREGEATFAELRAVGFHGW